MRLSWRRDSQTFQLNVAAHVAGEVLKPDARPGANNPDTAHQRPAHVVALRAEDMLDADTIKDMS